MTDYDPTTEDENLDLDDKIDNDDDDAADTTGAFQPTGASTPYQPGNPYHIGERYEMSHLPQEQSGQDGTRDTDPLLEGDELDQRLQQTRQASPWVDLTEMYPNANKDALEASSIYGGT